LTSSDWTPTPLHSLLSAEIETHGKVVDRLIVVGPDVMLQPRAFTPMALVVHELVTNARKYGALSVPSGQITVTTASDEIGNVSVTWVEAGGPAVTAPIRKGFGSTVLAQVIPFELNGNTMARYHTLGYCLTLCFQRRLLNVWIGLPPCPSRRRKIMRLAQLTLSAS